MDRSVGLNTINTVFLIYVHVIVDIVEFDPSTLNTILKIISRLSPYGSQDSKVAGGGMLHVVP